MERASNDGLGSLDSFSTPDGASYSYYSLEKLASQGYTSIDKLPLTIKLFLENLLRTSSQESQSEIDRLARWSPQDAGKYEFPWMPARVLLQDFTGVPVVVDLAAMRSAAARMGKDPKKINPLVPTDLVIDHSVQVDFFGTRMSFYQNVELEYQRNGERYALLRWAQQAFDNFRVVPPGTGIVHQVNLEYLAKVVQVSTHGNKQIAYPDTLVGTDSHTTMVNGLSVLGWGVGGIEAEAVQLGQPMYIVCPEVIGFKIIGEMKSGTTATDLVLTITQILRQRGVVDKFVEFFGPGLDKLSVADRATISNMCPEYGATAAIWPIDDETLRYLRMTGRSDELVNLVERYAKLQGIFRYSDSPEAIYSDVIELDLSTVEPSMAGPRRPQDRVALQDVRRSFYDTFGSLIRAHNEQPSGAVSTSSGTATLEAKRVVDVRLDGQHGEVSDGSVVIAAITSCTNTSNPSVMLAAGLVAKKAVERGLLSKPWVKTSLAPGSQVVTDYLERSGLLPFLEALRFHLVGYGCTTCIGNSGAILGPVAEAVQENELVVAAVLSGNRNFEGRINPLVRAAYLASPPLVVVYALAGTVDLDLTKDPVAYDPNGQPVFLHDIWPTQEELNEVLEKSVSGDSFRKIYSNVFSGDDHWRNLPVPQGELYSWDPDSTYVQEPPYFDGMSIDPEPLQDIHGARVLALLGDSVTTDHISPAGSIPRNSPAGQYLMEKGVPPVQFNSFGSRRGNHEVMMRGTFGNIRLRNMLVPDREGNWTIHIPSGEVTSIYEAAMRYKDEGVPLIVIAGKEYGTGSSRDWAAKGPNLLGVKAVIAESFERIHRSNLIGMGVLPLQFLNGQNAQSLGLSGKELYHVSGITHIEKPRSKVSVVAVREDGSQVEFEALARIDTPKELEYYKHGGVLQYVLRSLIKED